MHEPAAVPPDGAWPFLVARSRSVGYRTVPAPPFLVDRGLHYLLIRAAAVESPIPDKLLRRDVRDMTTGDYTLIFRVAPANPSIVGQRGDVLRDEASRPVDITEGVVLTGPEPALEPGMFEAAHQVIAEVFRDFWQADDPYANPVRATPLRPEQVRELVNQPTADMPAPVSVHPFERPAPLPAGHLPTPQPDQQPVAAHPPADPSSTTHPPDRGAAPPPHRKRVLWLAIVGVAVVLIVGILLAVA